MSDHTYSAYFNNRYDASRAEDVLSSLAKVTPPEPAEPYQGRPWRIIITLPQSAGLSTLVVSAPITSKIVEMVTKYNGVIADPS